VLISTISESPDYKEGMPIARDAYG
jgi:hypothetical protein